MADESKARYGDVLGPDENASVGHQSSGLALRLPPGVRDMSLSRAILGQLPYWGARRTIDAYRQMIEAGLQTVAVQKDFYKATRELEMEKERWQNRDIYREGAKLEALAYLDGVKIQRNAAAAAVEDSEVFLQQAKDRRAAMELLRVIEANNREAERLASEREMEEEQQRLDEVRGGRGASFRQKLRRMEEAKQNYAELMEAKAADAVTYGGEENIPEFLIGMYEQMEADLMFTMEGK